MLLSIVRLSLVSPQLVDRKRQTIIIIGGWSAKNDEAAFKFPHRIVFVRLDVMSSASF